MSSRTLKWVGPGWVQDSCAKVAAFDDNKVAVVFRDMSKDSGLAFSNAFLNL